MWLEGVVSKDETFEAVRHYNRAVSDATLSSRIKAARYILGDDGSAQQLICTVHGRGFRFVGKVEELIDRGELSPPAGVVLQPSDRPSLVVMPFDNLSEADDAHFVDGVVEVITSALSLVRDFFVIARQSAFAYKGRFVEVREVASRRLWRGVADCTRGRQQTSESDVAPPPAASAIGQSDHGTRGHGRDFAHAPACLGRRHAGKPSHAPPHLLFRQTRRGLAIGRLTGNLDPICSTHPRQPNRWPSGSRGSKKIQSRTGTSATTSALVPHSCPLPLPLPLP